MSAIDISNAITKERVIIRVTTYLIGIISESGGIIKKSTIPFFRKIIMTSWRTAKIVDRLYCHHSASAVRMPSEPVIKIMIFSPAKKSDLSLNHHEDLYKARLISCKNVANG